MHTAMAAAPSAKPGYRLLDTGAQTGYGGKSFLVHLFGTRAPNAQELRESKSAFGFDKPSVVGYLPYTPDEIAEDRRPFGSTLTFLHRMGIVDAWHDDTLMTGFGQLRGAGPIDGAGGRWRFRFDGEDSGITLFTVKQDGVFVQRRALLQRFSDGAAIGRLGVRHVAITCISGASSTPAPSGSTSVAPCRARRCFPSASTRSATPSTRCRPARSSSGSKSSAACNGPPRRKSFPVSPFRPRSSARTAHARSCDTCSWRGTRCGGSSASAPTTFGSSAIRRCRATSRSR